MKKFWLAAGAFCACFAVSGEVIRLPLSNAAIKIDGKINAAEWRCGSMQYGSRRYDSKRLTDRQAVFFLARDSRNIYFACRSEVPPKGQKLLSRVRKDGLMVTMDDTVELHLYPPRGKYVYQIILNGRKAKYCAKYEMLSGAIIRKPKPFAPKVVAGSVVDKDNWEIEVQLPLSEMEIPAAPANEPWKVQMVRSWQNPAESSSFTRTRIFCNPDTMAELFFDNSSAVAGFAGLGKKYAAGEYELSFPLYNPTGKKRTLQCSVNVKSTAAPRERTGSITLEPGTSGNFTLKYVEKADFIYEMDALISENGKTLYKRNFTWGKPAANRWENMSAKLNSADLEFAVYPGLKEIKMRYGSPDVRVPRNLLKAEFFILGKNGKPYGAVRAGQSKNYGFTARWQTGELPAGDYHAAVRLHWKEGKTTEVKKPFKIRRFEWENNKIGTERVVIPPFKPLRVEKDKRQVSALLTGYKGSGPLWQAVFAENENILADGITLSVNGDKGFFREKDFKFTEVAPDVVRSVAGFTGKGLSLSVENSYEYDGMCKTVFNFKPQGSFTAGNITLEIPIKNSVAEFYHCVNDVPRYHPADRLPAGNGVLWDSRKGKLHPRIRGNFWPYVWIGGLHKGLCWFAPSDLNWSLDPAKPALEIVRKGDRVSLLVHLVNTPVKWNKPVSIVMGFQATPVKKAPANWRQLAYQKKSSAGIKGVQTLFYWGWGATTNWNSWPANNDYSIVNRMSRENRKNPAARLEQKHIREFIAKNGKAFPQEKMHVLDFHLRANLQFRNYEYICHYLNPRSGSSKWESYQVYQNEWFYTEYRSPVDYDEYNIEAVKSYQDMLLWNIRKLLRAGSDGIYFDNVRTRATYDPVRGPAYELGNGKIQPYFDFFSFREMLKRTATLLYLEKKTFMDGRPYLTLHMTNGNLIPFLSFAAVQLDLESEYGPKEFHDRFTEGYFLTESIGTQGGNVPQILCSITGNNRDFVARTFLAVQLAVDIPMCIWIEPPRQVVRKTWQKLYDFGYGSEKVKVYPSWDKANPVTVSASSARVSTYLKPEQSEALLAVCDLGNRAGDVTVDVSKLGFTSGKCIDLEANREVPVRSGKVTLHLPRRDFRLLKLQKAK